MIKSLMIISILILSLNYCSRIEFDNFDPVTSTLKWAIQQHDDK